MLLVVDNGSIYTKNLIDFLSENKVKFIVSKFDEIDSLDKSEFDSLILSGRIKNSKNMNAINSQIIQNEYLRRNHCWVYVMAQKF